MSLLITFLLGIFFIFGIAIIRIFKRQVVEHISISVALGALLALLFIDLLPEAFESLELGHVIRSIIFIIVGIAILKLLDTFVPEHDAHDEMNDDSMIHIGVMSAIAITLHNVLEGMTVFNIAQRELMAGISLGVGVGLHNIPMGMLIYATLKREHGFKKYGLLFLTVVSTFIGGLLMFGMSPYLTESVLGYLVCITIGMVIFIVFFELLPSVIKSERKLLSVVCVLVGLGIVLLSTLLE